MTSSLIPERQRTELSRIIAAAMGLHYPAERWPDLERGLSEAAQEEGFAGVAAYATALLSGPLDKTRLQTLARYLTIGETYFYREPATLDALAFQALPALIHARRGGAQRLRLWSAASCTGEEAYTLAILVRQALPDLADWQVSILATDINPHFLKRAAAGVYTEWSFRQTPPGFKERYFTKDSSGRYTLASEIRDMVRFEHLNLVEDWYPSLDTGTNAMDIILCRNVLIYFSPEHVRLVADKLQHALADGGWLAVSPCEVSQAWFPQFAPRNFPGAILYQKDHGRPSTRRLPRPVTARWLRPPSAREAPAASLSGAPAAPSLPVPRTTPPAKGAEEAPAACGQTSLPDSYASALACYEQGLYGEAEQALVALCAQPQPDERCLSLLARTLANTGRLAEALTWCDRWAAAEKLNPAAYYLRAVVQLELGLRAEAERSLRQALFLHPDFVLAHFTLGNLARDQGQHAAADKHLACASRLLQRLQPEDLLPESEGLTAGQLHATISALRTGERRP